jgi:hypothetical protein
MNLLIAQPGFRAYHHAIGVRVLQDMAVSAHPTLLAGGIAHHKGVVGHVLRHHAAGGNETVPPQGGAADNGGIGPDRGPAPDEGLLVQAVAVDLRPGIGDVRQDTGRPKEDVILDNRAGVDRDVVLHLHVVADRHAAIHVHVLAEYAALADLRALHDVRKMPNFCARANYRAVIDIRRLVLEIFAHIVTWLEPRNTLNTRKHSFRQSRLILFSVCSVFAVVSFACA